MSRSSLIQLLDPLDSVRYAEDRTAPQAADFLQLLGWPMSPGTLEGEFDKGNFGKTAKRTGKVSEAELVKYIKKNPEKLRELRHFEPPEGFLTPRMAMEQYKGLTLSYFLKSLAAGAPHQLHRDADDQSKRTIVLHESWLRNAVASPTQDFMTAVKAPVSSARPQKAAVSHHDKDKGVKVEHHEPEATLETAVPDEAPESVADTVPEQAKPVKAEILKPFDASVAPLQDNTKRYLSLGEAAQFLQLYGYEVTDYQIYHAGVRAPVKKIRLKRIGRPWYIELDYLEGLIKRPSAWLRQVSAPFEAPDGFVLTRTIIIENQFSYSRLKEAIAAKLVEVEPYNNASNGKGQIFVIRREVYEDIKTNEPLCHFLKGEAVTIEEIQEWRHNRPQPERTPRSEAPTGKPQGETPHTPPPSTPEPEPNHAETEHTLEDVLAVVHSARRAIRDYEVAIDEGWSDTELVDYFGQYYLK